MIDYLLIFLVPFRSSSTPLYLQNVASQGACPSSLFFHCFHFRLTFESIKELGSVSTIAIPNVSILKTQAMNFNIGHTVVPVNYYTTWSQLITPIVQSKTNMLNTSTYLTWYNVILLFVLLILICIQHI